MIFDNKSVRPKAVLVSIPLPKTSDEDAQSSLNELARLVTTLGFDIVGRLTQRRPSRSGSSVLGEGKLKELAHFTGGTGVVPSSAPKRKNKAQEKFLNQDPQRKEDSSEYSDDRDAPKANVVVFDCDLTPSQLVNVQGATGVEVLDRTGVIVEIFSRHAKTKQAKIQVEMARLKYLAPRLREAGEDPGDRMGGTAGETSLELDRRKIRDRIALLRKELESLQGEQASRRSSRSDQACVALVGYTNAGKSSLMRALTGSDVLVEDKLFATLDTTVRTLHPKTSPTILITDTVGFIKELPHDLVASFRSTLDEAKNASLLLYVVDASDPTFRSQLQVTREVLNEIGVEDTPSLLILNKADQLSGEEIKQLLREFPRSIALSSQNPKDIKGLHTTILHFFEEGMLEEEILIPYTSQGIIKDIRSNMRVLKEEYKENGVYLLIKAHQKRLTQLKKELKLQGKKMP